jgi:hypothetical protein
MIVEMRTYTLQPGTVGQFEERFGAALAVRARCPRLPPSGIPRWAH